MTALTTTIVRGTGLAKVSFGIYFIRYPWILFLEHTDANLAFAGYPLLSVAVSAALVLALSLATVALCRQLLGARSKWLVGA